MTPRGLSSALFVYFQKANGWEEMFTWDFADVPALHQIAPSLVFLMLAGAQGRRRPCASLLILIPRGNWNLRPKNAVKPLPMDASPRPLKKQSYLGLMVFDVDRRSPTVPTARPYKFACAVGSLESSFAT
jgi:hypothetical protein